MRPKVVLVEGLADANELVQHITKKATKPPIAILAYTDTLPVRTLVYPLARYSPEYQAILWAKENNSRVEFIDLPSDIFLAFQDVEAEIHERARREAAEAASKDEATNEKDCPVETERTEDSNGAEADRWSPEPPASLYERLAQQSHEPDYETYWERHFEHNRSPDHSYRLASYEFGRALRELEEYRPRWRAENLVREAFMRHRIEAVLASGVKPEKIVAVVGRLSRTRFEWRISCHDGRRIEIAPVPVQQTDIDALFVLQAFIAVGIRSGKSAPAYFELLWDAARTGRYPRTGRTISVAR